MQTTMLYLNPTMTHNPGEDRLVIAYLAHLSSRCPLSMCTEAGPMQNPATGGGGGGAITSELLAQWLVHSPGIWESQGRCSADYLIVYPKYNSVSRRDCGRPTSEHPIAQGLKHSEVGGFLLKYFLKYFLPSGKEGNQGWVSHNLGKCYNHWPKS